MDTKDIQTRLNGMIRPMLDKGLVKPEARLYLRADSTPSVSISWDKPNRPSFSYDRINFYGEGEAIEDRLASVDAHIAALPGKDETTLRNFMDALGNVIDMGREHGIEVAFINPLTETMKKLSENALTYQKAAAE